MSRRPVVPAVFVALAVVLVPGLRPAGAADARSEVVAERAITYIASQQRSDGGFGSGEAGFPGFETPDAVLAIAESAQQTLVYDARAARAAVQSVRRDGKDGLHYLDDLADGGLDAGQAAKLVLVARAVGIGPAAFDPDGDGATNLVAVIDAARKPDGSYGDFFNSTLQVMIAFPLLGRPVGENTVSYVRRAQQPSGGFDYTGDPESGNEDIDTTARAVQALVAAGQPPSSGALQRALAFLAERHNPDGSWSAFGAPDPNATAQAVLALEALGYDVEDECWRSAVGRPAAPYVSPDEWLRRQQAGDGHIAGPADEFGVNTYSTSQAVQALLRNFQPVLRADPQPCKTTGYRLVAADGGVFAFGDVTFAGSTGDIALNRPIVASAATPSGEGYWLFAADGGVFAFGDASFYGSTGGIRLNHPIVGAAATPTGGGYWLFAADGGVFSFGDAPFLGSTGDLRLERPVVAGAATPSGEGYWLFAGDGGVFAFGDAVFRGSTAGLDLSDPVVAGVASRTGRGYHLVAADGGVFSFGDAVFSGSTGNIELNQPIVGALRSKGDGYYLVAADGGLFAFGDAPFLGSEGGRRLNSPVVTANR